MADTTPKFSSVLQEWDAEDASMAPVAPVAKAPNFKKVLSEWDAEDAPVPSPSILRRAGDFATSLARGVVALPEAAVGLADLATTPVAAAMSYLRGKVLPAPLAELGDKIAAPGFIGRGLQAVGVDFKGAKKTIGEMYSPAQQAANRKVDEAQGVAGTIKAMAENPSTIIQGGAESLPSMLAGNAIGKGLSMLAPKVAGWAGGALGEGAITAGGQAEQNRQNQPSGQATLKGQALAVGSGLLTSLISAAGGKIADKAGLVNPDAWFAMPKAQRVSAARMLVGGAASMGVEGGEEFLQSGQEQIAQNIANDRPWLEGVDEDAAKGFMASLGTTGAINAAAPFVAGQGQPEREAPTASTGNPDLDAFIAQESVVPEDAAPIAVNPDLSPVQEPVSVPEDTPVIIPDSTRAVLNGKGWQDADIDKLTAKMAMLALDGTVKPPMAPTEAAQEAQDAAPVNDLQAQDAVAPAGQGNAAPPPVKMPPVAIIEGAEAYLSYVRKYGPPSVTVDGKMRFVDDDTGETVGIADKNYSKRDLPYAPNNALHKIGAQVEYNDGKGWRIGTVSGYNRSTESISIRDQEKPASFVVRKSDIPSLVRSPMSVETPPTRQNQPVESPYSFHAVTAAPVDKTPSAYLIHATTPEAAAQIAKDGKIKAGTRGVHFWDEGLDGASAEILNEWNGEGKPLVYIAIPRASVGDSVLKNDDWVAVGGSARIESDVALPAGTMISGVESQDSQEPDFAPYTPSRATPPVATTVETPAGGVGASVVEPVSPPAETPAKGEKPLINSAASLARAFTADPAMDIAPYAKWHKQAAAKLKGEAKVAFERAAKPVSEAPVAPAPREYVYNSPNRPVASISSYLPKGYRLVGPNQFAVNEPLPKELEANLEVENADPNHPSNMTKRFNKFKDEVASKIDPYGTEITLKDGRKQLISSNIDPNNSSKYPFRITHLLPDGTPGGHDVYKDITEIAREIWSHSGRIAKITVDGQDVTMDTPAGRIEYTPPAAIAPVEPVKPVEKPTPAVYQGKVGFRMTPKQIQDATFKQLTAAAKGNTYGDGTSVWDSEPVKGKDAMRKALRLHREQYMAAEGKSERKPMSFENRNLASQRAKERMINRVADGDKGAVEFYAAKDVSDIKAGPDKVISEAELSDGDFVRIGKEWFRVKESPKGKTLKDGTTISLEDFQTFEAKGVIDSDHPKIEQVTEEFKKQEKAADKATESGKEVYIKGDRAILTGEVREIAGAKFNVAIMAEGIDKGKERVTPTKEQSAKDVAAKKQEWQDQQKDFAKLNPESKFVPPPAKPKQSEIFPNTDLGFELRGQTQAAAPTFAETQEKLAAKAEQDKKQGSLLDSTPAPQNASAFRAKLDAMEQSARKKLDDMGGRATTGFDVDRIAALSQLAAAKIGKAGLTFAEWSKDAITEFGDAIKPHLQAIWDKANAIARKDFAVDDQQMADTGQFVRGPDGQPTSPTGKITGINRDSLNANREAMGLPQDEGPDKQTWEEADAIAAARIANDSGTLQKTMDALVEGTKTPDATDASVLRRGLIERERIMGDALAAQQKAKASGNADAMTSANEAYAKARADYLAVYNVMQSGENSPITNIARFLANLRAKQDQNFNLVHMIADLEATQKKPADQKQIDALTAVKADMDAAKKEFSQAEITDLVNRLVKERVAEEAQRIQDEANAQRELDKAESADKWASEVDEAVKALAKSKSASTAMKERGKARKAEAIAEFKAYAAKAGMSVSAVVDPMILKPMAKYGLGLLEEGVGSFGEWAIEMRKVFGSTASTSQLKTVFDEQAKIVNQESADEASEQIIKDEDSDAPGTPVAGEPADLVAGLPKGKDPETAMMRRVRRLMNAQARSGTTEVEVAAAAVAKELQKTFPDITVDEVYRLYSRYGKKTDAPTTPIAKRIAQFISQSRNLTHLNRLIKRRDRLMAGLPYDLPDSTTENTGQQRVPPDARTRELEKEVRKLNKDIEREMIKRKIPLLNRDAQIASATKARHTALKNQIEAINIALAKHEEMVRNNQALPDDPETLRLRKIRDERMADYDKIFPAKPITEEQRITIAMKSEARRLASMQKKYQDALAGRTTAKEKADPVRNAELDAMRDEIDMIKADLKTLWELSNPRMSAEEAAVDAFIKSKERTVRLLEKKMSTGDFSTKPRKYFDASQSPAAMEAAAKEGAAKVRYAEMKELARLSQLGPLMRGWDIVKDVWDEVRELRSSFDMNAIGRQGWVSLLTRTPQWARAVKASVLASSSKNSAISMRQITDSVEARKGWLSHGLKLATFDASGNSINSDDRWKSRYVSRLPGIKWSNRTYGVFLNVLRYELFKAYIKLLPDPANPTNDELKGISGMVNTFTGVGKVPFGSKAASRVFYAPSFVASQAELIFGKALFSKSPVVRKIARKEYAKLLLSSALIMAALGATGGEDDEGIEMHPTSTNFGTFKLGHQRIGTLSHLRPMFVLLMRIANGHVKTPTQDKRLTYRLPPWVDENKVGEKVAFSSGIMPLLGTFIRSKLHPGVSLGTEVWSGQNYQGKKTPLGKTLLTALPPLSPGQVAELAQTESGIKLLTLAIGTLIGGDIQPDYNDPVIKANEYN